MALENEDIEQIKGILKESLKESGLTDAAGKVNQPERMTKEQIMSIRNTKERQQKIRENLDLFRN